MTPRDHLQKFIDAQGGIPAAAKALGMPYQTLRGIAKGWRGISHRQATRMAEASDGALDAETLIWVRPTKGSDDTDTLDSAA